MTVAFQARSDGRFIKISATSEQIIKALIQTPMFLEVVLIATGNVRTSNQFRRERLTQPLKDNFPSSIEPSTFTSIAPGVFT